MSTHPPQPTRSRTFISARPSTAALSSSRRRRRATSPWPTMVVVLTTALVLLGSSMSAAASGSATPHVSELAAFAAPSCTGQCGSGSTIGPDDALYVTDGPGGRLLRIERRTGSIQTVTDELPPTVPAIGIGGAVDVAFLGRIPYVLVTVVGPAVGQPGTVAGIYRVGRDGHVHVVADIGAWSMANPPDTDFAVASGVQYAMSPYRGGFLVSDGHHNRVLHVSLSGRIVEVQTFDNTVPTGMDNDGDRVLLAEAGPVPHHPETGRVITWSARHPRPVVLASGAPLAVDVQVGTDHRVWVLAQGLWDHPNVPENAGLPASPDTGVLLRLHRGQLQPVVRRLDRPTSVQLVGHEAYVVTLTGKVLLISDL